MTDTLMSDDTATDDTAADGRATAETDGDTATTRGRLRGLLPWLLVVALAGALAWVGPQWWELRGAEAERLEVATVAREVVTRLTTWDASDGLEDTIADLRAVGTGSFADEVDPFFAGPQGEALVAAGASSASVVRDLFVQAIDGDDATVFVTLDQSVQTANPPESSLIPRRAIVDLVRVDGTWLAADVTVTDGILGPAPVTEDAP